MTLKIMNKDMVQTVLKSNERNLNRKPSPKQIQNYMKLITKGFNKVLEDDKFTCTREILACIKEFKNIQK